MIGGFHVVPPLGDDYIRKTIEEFRQIDPDYLITAHCTGDRFYDLARAALGDKVIHSAVGTRFVFEALSRRRRVRYLCTATPIRWSGSQVAISGKMHRITIASIMQMT